MNISSRIMGLRLLAGLAAVAGATKGAASSFPISVINLNKDTARLAAVKAQFAKSKVGNWRRLSAVYGANLTPAELRQSTTALARLFATPGMIGCYLSHRAFWEQTLAEDAPWACVLEDDVKLADNFCEKVRGQQRPCSFSSCFDVFRIRVPEQRIIIYFHLLPRIDDIDRRSSRPTPLPHPIRWRRRWGSWRRARRRWASGTCSC